MLALQGLWRQTGHEGYRPGAPCANDWAAPSMQPIPGDTHNRLENTELETTASQVGLIAESQPWQQQLRPKTGPCYQQAAETG